MSLVPDVASVASECQHIVANKRQICLNRRSDEILLSPIEPRSVHLKQNMNFWRYPSVNLFSIFNNLITGSCRFRAWKLNYA